MADALRSVPEHLLHDSYRLKTFTTYEPSDSVPKDTPAGMDFLDRLEWLLNEAFDDREDGEEWEDIKRHAEFLASTRASGRWIAFWTLVAWTAKYRQEVCDYGETTITEPPFTVLRLLQLVPDLRGKA